MIVDVVEMRLLAEAKFSRGDKIVDLRDESLGCGDLGCGDQSLGWGDQNLGYGDESLGWGDQSLGWEINKSSTPSFGH